MAIRPPSDIVLDVALAADPAKRDAATRRLSATGIIDGDRAFATTLASDARPFRNVQRSEMSHARPPAADARDPAAKALNGLEAFFLRTAFERMMPDARAKGPLTAGGGMWKSMLADALATQAAASGSFTLGIGAASTMKTASS